MNKDNVVNLFNKIDIKDNSKTLQPTFNLRILEYIIDHGNGTGSTRQKLQQGWLETTTGLIEWKDVEIVKEV